MPSLRTLRRLLSRASQDWSEVANDLFRAPVDAPGPRPLRIMRLERRRVLSADFALVDGGLLLDGFEDDGATLSISQQDSEYLFTTDDGWNAGEGPLPEGVAIEGDTLAVDRGLVDTLPAGITIAGDGSPLDVSLGTADFSGLDGPLTLVAPTSIDQQPFALLTAPDAGLQLMVAPAGLTVGSLTVSGNLEVFAFGQITDGPGTQILVTGDATFTTRTGGADIPAGITLADTPGDRLVVGGEVKFDAIEGPDRYDIRVGEQGWTEFGEVTALGGEVVIGEKASTELKAIDATNFELNSAGLVNADLDATIDVAEDASITSTGSRHRADFDGDRAVTNADYDLWAANHGRTTGVSRATGDANGDGLVNAADYTIWRDTLGAADAGGGIVIAAADRFQVGGEARLVARDGADRYDITVSQGVDAAFGSLWIDGAFANIWEDAGGTATGTHLTGVDATTLVLNTDGSLTDAPTAHLVLSDDLLVDASGAIVLADAGNADNRLEVADLARLTGAAIDVGVNPANGSPAASLATIGRMTLNAPGAARIALDGDATFDGQSSLGTLSVHTVGELTDAPSTGGRDPVTIDVSGDADFFAADGITLADSPTASNRLNVDGFALFEVGSENNIDIGVNPADGSPADATATLGSMSLIAPGGNVRVALDGGAFFDDATASQNLTVSAWLIADNQEATVDVDDEAVFRSAGDIDLANGNENNRLAVAGVARFFAGEGETITIGDRSGGGLIFPPGIPAAAHASLASVQFHVESGLAHLLLDDSTILADDSLTGSLLFDVAGDLANDPGASLNVSNDARLIAHGGDRIGPTLGEIDLGVTNTGTFNFGTLGLRAGDVAIREASSTDLTHVDVESLRLTSTGWIIDQAGHSIDVAGSAVFTASSSNNITLDNDSVNFGDVGLFGAAITVREASGTVLSGVDALEFDLVSTGKVEDLDDAVIFILGPSTIEGATGVMLGDGTADNTVMLSFFELATVLAGNGQTIMLGVDPAGTPSGDDLLANADADFRSGAGLRVSAPGGLIQVADDATPAVTDFQALILAGEIRAETLVLQSADAILDASTPDYMLPIADIEVTGAASFRAEGGIVLADGPTEDNRLVIGGFGFFSVATDQNIDLGVQTNGMPADAIFSAGALGFQANGGTVRIAEDAGTTLGGASLAEALQLDSAGPITDQPDASTEVTGFAELNAGDGAADVVLGDEDATFSLGDPALFDEAEYLAIAAHNASVQADSAVNVRTSAADPNLGGTYHLTATGPISQVGGPNGDLRPLTAERISLASDGAVLFSAVELTSEGGAPNLQIKAGEAIDLADEIGSSNELAARFGSERIPSSVETDLSPAIVEADLADGTRPDQPAREDENGRLDPGLEDVVIGDGPSPISERAPEGGFQPPVNTGPDSPIDIGDDYSAIVRVVGDATVGDVVDPTGATADDAIARGLAVTTTGAAYLDTTGSLTFTGEGRFGEAEAGQVEVVAMSGGVLTAVAGTVLRIDTEDPDQPAAVKRTTKLSSATGAVTSLAPEGQSGEDAAPGPRLVLDTSTEEFNAATTGLVRADTDFEQRITAAIGSRGEDNLIVEVEWADVAQVREQSVARPSVRAAYDSADVVGSNELADLIQTPVEAIEQVEADTATTGLEYQELEGEFRVVTIRHNYAQEFVPSNPAQDSLPTTVRVFNDPAINLFDQGGERDLNNASLTIAPRIITLPPAGFFLLSEPDLPAQYAVADAPVTRDAPTPETQRSVSDEGRATVVSSAESVEFGRIDASGEWVRDLPGEPWPQVRDDAEGDFLREIRDQIDEGPYSEGRYRIQIRTPRGEQLLEEWTKGDLNAEENQEAFDEPTAEPAVDQDAALEAAPAEPTAVRRRLDAAPLSDETLSEASSAAFAAMAAVGVWRRKLGDGERLQLDDHGVGYTRLRRRRRR
ncbi:hypothetical protein MalM25_09180 [Planctomycetes bacterium MalM25]|nr:hypothetical protein MalM25_09180 [Planctomycetes bacterium MalM25]